MLLRDVMIGSSKQAVRAVYTAKHQCHNIPTETITYSGFLSCFR